MAINITLSDEERQQAQTAAYRGKVTGRVRTRAQILLKLAEAWPVEQICQAFEVCRATVYNTVRRYQQSGIEGVLHDQEQAHRRQALTGEEEALLVAITCSPVPEGHDHWTLRMLRGKLIELGVVECISPATIHTLLKKTNSSRGGTSRGASPRSMPRS